MSKKVLVVDDEPNVVVSLEFLMHREGFGVTTAQNGEEGLERIRAERPDLVLLDAMMPGINGYDVCRQVRNDPGLEGTRILMLSAKGRDADVNEGLAVGADAFLPKPFGTRDLRTQVRSLLELEA